MKAIKQKKRVGIIFLIIALILFALWLSYSRFLNCIEVNCCRYCGNKITVINKCGMGFIYVKVKLLLNDRVLKTIIYNLKPFRQRSFNLSLDSSEIIGRIYATGVNVGSLIIAATFIVATLSYLWIKHYSSKYCLKLVGASIYQTDHNKSIKGVIKNNCGREFSNIKMRFAVYNSDGSQIGITAVIIDNLQPHRRAIFKKLLSQKLIEMGASSFELIGIIKA